MFVVCRKDNIREVLRDKNGPIKFPTSAQAYQQLTKPQYRNMMVRHLMVGDLNVRKI